MKKVNIVKQRDIKDCGVCSMLSVIKYYGGFVSIEKLRELTNTTIDGTTAFNIVYAFRKIGFDSYAIRTDDIKNSNLKFPLIAHFLLSNGCYHFVVVYSFNERKVTLMDPSVGKTIMTVNEFNKLFTGNIIISIPKDKEVIKEDDINIENIIYNFLKKEKDIVIKLIVLSIIFSIITIILSYYFKIYSNNLNSITNLCKVIFIFMCLTILKELINYSKSYYGNYLNLRIDNTMFEKFITHIFFLPLKNIKSRSTGEIMTRIKELEIIKEIFSNIFIMLFLDLLLGMVSLTFLFIINKKLCILLIGIILLYILFGLLINDTIYKKIMININYETEVNSKLIEYIDMISSIKNLNITNKVLINLEEYICNYIQNSFDFDRYYNIVSLIKNYILEIGFFLLNSIGFIQIYYGNFTIIDLITFNLLICYAIAPMKNIVELLPKYNHIKIIIVKIKEFLTIEKEEIKNASSIILKGNIEVSNLNYSYDFYNNIVENVSFSIKEKDKVFLCGESGVGKSTLCNLLYKNLVSSSGNIKIDNVDINNYELSDIRNNILYVNQDEKILCETIKENILFNRNIDIIKFTEICNLCFIDDILKNKSAGLNSMVDSFTKNISGGEKQRIILARGLLKDSNIIILDEALSEVDYHLEKKIIKNILNYFEDKTIIYISHKEFSDLFDYTINLEKKHEKIL